MESATQLSLLMDRIEYEEEIFGSYGVYENVLNRLLEDSKYLALSLRFPYQDFSSKELPEKYKNWQLRCSVEIYQELGREGIKSYSENGLAWSKDSGYISYELRHEIEPMVGFIEDSEDDVNV